MLWIGQGTYLAECTVDNNADVLQGIFWLVFQFSQVFGNFFASLFLTSPDAQMVFFCVLLAVAIGSVFLFGCTILRTYGRHPCPVQEDQHGDH
ncbi:MAG: hypothetical protein P4M11_14475 [Candidatus Pacebacteria bacterium]|nr:hypothetical protein [Candidatus Paceibacterota bacterium]